MMRTFPPCAGANRGCWKPDIVQVLSATGTFSASELDEPSEPEGGHLVSRRNQTRSAKNEAPKCETQIEDECESWN